MVSEPGFGSILWVVSLALAFGSRELGEFQPFKPVLRDFCEPDAEF